MVEREGVRGQRRGKGACVGVRVRAWERRGRMCACGREGGRKEEGEGGCARAQVVEGEGTGEGGRVRVVEREWCERGWGRGQCPSQ